MTLETYNDVYLYSPFNHMNVPLTPMSKMDNNMKYRWNSSEIPSNSNGWAKNYIGPFYETLNTPSREQLVSLDGIHSGVPTRTTATLTPTTLRNIEQTFFELTNDPPTTVPCQAGFVPPLPSFPFEQDHQDHSLGSTETSSNSSWQTPPPAINEEVITGSYNTAPTPSRRNMGGRRPKHSSNLTPEEENKRKVRRERNKLAAARCRKRRVDQTNELIDKVEALERDKQKLQNEIQELQMSKEDLELYLDSHRHCDVSINGRKSPEEFKQPIPHIFSMVDKIKVEPIDSHIDGPPSPKRILLSSSNPVIAAPAITLHTPNGMKPSRPSSLNVPLTITPSQALGMSKTIADMAGIPITTPSSGVMFNFDSLMDGGTGLTPVSQPLMPNCSSQNKNPLDLATPTTEPSKLVCL